MLSDGAIEYRRSVRKERMQTLKNMTDEQWETLGLVDGVLRDLVREMRLHPDEPDYHNRDNWHPLYKIYIDFTQHMCLDDYNDEFLYSSGWDAHFTPYEYVKKWR